MFGKNHGKSYRETRIREPASCRIPESFLYNGYLGRKAVPQKTRIVLLAGRHGRGIHSLSLWKAEVWLCGVRAPWDFFLRFVWAPCGALCFETPGRAAALRPPSSRHAVGSRVRKTLYVRLAWRNGPPQEGTFVPDFRLASDKVRNSAQKEEGGKRERRRLSSPPDSMAPSCP